MTMQHLAVVTRRTLLLGGAAVAALPVFAPALAAADPARPEAPNADIRPFRVSVPQEALDDLRRRLAQARLPEQETVGDRSQGVQLAEFQRLVTRWANGYDWRKA